MAGEPVLGRVLVSVSVQWARGIGRALVLLEVEIRSPRAEKRQRTLTLEMPEPLSVQPITTDLWKLTY